MAAKVLRRLRSRRVAMVVGVESSVRAKSGPVFYRFAHLANLWSSQALGRGVGENPCKLGLRAPDFCLRMARHGALRLLEHEAGATGPSLRGCFSRLGRRRHDPEVI